MAEKDTIVADIEGTRRNFIVRAMQSIVGLSAFTILESVSALAQSKGIGQKKSSISSIQTTSPYFGEIQITTANFAPRGWAMCNGQLLPISTNQELFSLLGTTYGGDGRTTFALPDLRGKMPVGISDIDPSFSIGVKGGEESHTLTLPELPLHTHYVNASPGTGSLSSPANAYPAINAQGIRQYSSTQNALMNAAAVNPTGSGQPHNNMPPYLVLNYIIALIGVYPTR